MEIIIGVTRDSQSLDSVALGMLIADAIGATPVIANVYPLAFDYPGPAHVDAEWHGFLIEQAHETLDGARANIGDRDGVEYCLLGHRSSGKGLAQLAIDRSASMIVIGSNNDASDGRIGSGSTANQLLHGSPVPVAIAPRGYSTWAPKRLGHIVLAYQRSSESDYAFNLILDTLLAHPVHGSLGLNLVTIIERVTKIYGSRLGRSAEQGVLAALREQALDGLRIAQSRVPAGLIDTTLELLEGDTVTAALAKFDWHDDDIFVAGSAGGGPLRRVFLGDMAYKLLRGSTLPVVIVPRGAES